MKRSVFGAKGEDDARIKELTVIKLDPQLSGFTGIVVSIEGMEKRE